MDKLICLPDQYHVGLVLSVPATDELIGDAFIEVLPSDQNITVTQVTNKIFNANLSYLLPWKGKCQSTTGNSLSTGSKIIFL
jgi:hypothetical protein